MAIYIGTFPKRTPLHPHFVRIEAHDIWSAREVAAHWYGNDCTVHEESRLPELLTQGMTEVALGTLHQEVS